MRRIVLGLLCTWLQISATPAADVESATAIAKELSDFETDPTPSMLKATILYWHAWDFPATCQEVTRHLIEHFTPSLLQDIEFFLPELAHMLVIFQRDASYNALENLLLTAAMISPRFAVRLSWALNATQGDYAAQFSDGSPNPKPSPEHFARIEEIRTNLHKALLEKSLPGENNLEKFASLEAFSNGLTQISESLRLTNREERTEKIKTLVNDLKLPQKATLPIGKEPDGYILDQADTLGCKPFSTRLRCPCLLVFDLKSENQDMQSKKVKIIAKSFDDVRQEALAMQMITLIAKIWARENLPLRLHTYEIVPSARDRGIMEFVEGNDLDHIFKALRTKPFNQNRLVNYFEEKYKSVEDAKDRFTESLAAYSVVCNLFAIKDRHNGNIMLTDNGDIVHIDFGFILGQAPGKDKLGISNFSLEQTAPFKLTREMMNVLGGHGSPRWQRFTALVGDGFVAIKKHAAEILQILEIISYRSRLACFNQKSLTAKQIIEDVKTRMMLEKSDDELRIIAARMCDDAREDLGTWLYECFQQWSNSIAAGF